MKGFKIATCVVLVLVVAALCYLFLIRKDSYTVTFDTAGGSKIEAVKVKKGGKVEKPTDPTKEGYTFTYWTLDSKEYDFSKEVTKNITLVAEWTKKSEEKEPENEPENVTCTKTCDKGYLLTSDCTCKKIAVTSVEVSAKDLELDIDESETLSVTVLPSGADSKVTFKSSDSSIASVDENGKITGHKAGTVTITVTSSDGSKKTTVSVTILDQYEFVATKLDDADISYMIAIYKNGEKVSDEVLSSIGAVYTADGKYIGRYEETLKAIMVDKTQISSVAVIKVDNKEYKIKEKKAI